MSDTPRTDEREALSEGLHEGWGLTLARQLERELNEAKAQLARVTEERDALLAVCKKILDHGHDDRCNYLNYSIGVCDCGSDDAITLIAKVETGTDA